MGVVILRSALAATSASFQRVAVCRRDHFRQRTTVCRQGLHGVHSDLGYQARQDSTVLPSIERWHKSLKGECSRPGTPLSPEDARRLVKGYVEHYNNVRLNSAIGYITPKDMLAGHQQEIQADRDRKLEAASAA